MNRKTIYQQLLALVVAIMPIVSLSAQRVEYFWDEDPGVGRGSLLQAFSGTEANIVTQLDVGTLSAGIHRLGLRALNDDKFSQTYYRSFYVVPQAEQITRIEYSWDKAVAAGQGVALPFTAGSIIDITEQLPADGLSEGIHTLYVQAYSSEHRSMNYARQFYVPAKTHKVQAVEYYFDEDPGVGQGKQMTATLSGESLNMNFEIDTEGLSDGVHHIGLRTLTDGTWSATKVRQFLVRSTTDVDDYITRLEYFWNDDPGEGKGYVVDITPGREVTVDFLADMTELGAGPHTLGLRAMSGSQAWSAASLTGGIEFEGWDNLQEYLNSLDDTTDEYLSGTSYSRQYKNGDWQALYIPFSLSYSDWSAHFDVARINAFYQYDDDEDGVVDRQVLEAIMVRSGNGQLKANHPYLIRAKQKGSYTLPATEAEAEQTNSVSCSTLEARYTFTGNYSNLTGLKTAQRYRLRGGSLSVPESDDEVLPPYRWYLTIDDLGNQLQQASRRLTIRVISEGDATGIDDGLITDLDAKVGQRRVFDMSGRRVDVSPEAPLSSLPKGVYIINQKKCIIK